LFVKRGRELVPFQDENEARRRLISVMVAAANLGEIPFVAISGGESFTKETFAELQSFARRKGITVLMEVATDELRKLGDADVYVDFRAA
jgi:MoaA/NifB/PqqE/SkfB family radical SAM enzyme